MGTGAISTGSPTASTQTYHLIGYMDNEKAFYAIDNFVRELEDEGLPLDVPRRGADRLGDPLLVPVRDDPDGGEAHQ